MSRCQENIYSHERAAGRHAEWLSTHGSMSRAPEVCARREEQRVIETWSRHPNGDPKSPEELTKEREERAETTEARVAMLEEVAGRNEKHRDGVQGIAASAYGNAVVALVLGCTACIGLYVIASRIEALEFDVRALAEKLRKAN